MAGGGGSTGGTGNRSKYILRQFPIIRFYAALALSVVFFTIQLVASHVAHSLILQIDCYHMLYNILTLATCIVTAKVSKEGTSLKNTFGWRRIDVCGAVANLCFLSALGFSVVVECLQAIFHASHHKTMQYPEMVGVVGVLGLVVNFVTFLLIGGYTLHQSGFLCSTKDGRGEDSVISAAMRRGPYDHVMREREGAFEIFRDIFGCVLVIVCAAIVFFWKDDNADYVDPCLTISTVLVLGTISYSYAVEAGHILLLTIPHHINVTSLQAEMKQHFPQVFDIHEFHVWQLTPARIIASVHVVLQRPHGYLDIQNKIIHFLHEKGISHVTMQPEFLQMTDGEVETPQTLRRRRCFLPCCAEGEEDCHDRQCCNNDDDHDHDDDHAHDLELEDIYNSQCHSHSRPGGSQNSHSPNMQSPSSLHSSSIGERSGVLLGGGIPGALKSGSLTNHLDISSMESIPLSKDISTSPGAANGAIVEEDSDSDDEAHGQSELRPMI